VLERGAHEVAVDTGAGAVATGAETAAEVGEEGPRADEPTTLLITTVFTTRRGGLLCDAIAFGPRAGSVPRATSQARPVPSRRLAAAAHIAIVAVNRPVEERFRRGAALVSVIALSPLARLTAASTHRAGRCP
jgi:hypothetical protein